MTVAAHPRGPQERPKRTAAFVATALALDPDAVASSNGNALAADLLGCASTGYGCSTALADLIAQANDARAPLLTLIQVLAGYEAGCLRGDWRHERPATSRYLHQLAALGYALAPVEQRACGQQPTTANTGSAQ